MPINLIEKHMCIDKDNIIDRYEYFSEGGVY